MKKYTKKLIAPIIIAFLLICYFLLYILIDGSIIDMPKFMKILIIIFPIGLIILTLLMLLERISEIKGGEEDDLSKY